MNTAKSTVNKIRNDNYLKKRNHIIAETDERIREIRTLIEKEKQRKMRLLDYLDDEYQDLNHNPDAIIQVQFTSSSFFAILSHIFFK